MPFSVKLPRVKTLASVGLGMLLDWLLVCMLKHRRALCFPLFHPFIRTLLAS
jgi:hypothetical protein